MGKNLFALTKRMKSSPIKSPKSSSPESSFSGSSGSPPPTLVPSPSVFRIRDSGDLSKVFTKYDVNGDGLISMPELESMLRCLGNNAADQEAESMMKAADLNEDGFISLEEFIAVNGKDGDSAEKCMQDLWNAFTVFDSDRNGLISAEELRKVLKGMGEKTSLAACKGMIKGVDRNGDGAVNFDEFLHMMTTRSIT